MSSVPLMALYASMERGPLNPGAVQSIAVGEYVAAAAALATRRAYQGDLKDFVVWGGTVPCDPTTVAEYMACRAQVHRPQTIARRLVGISRAHTTQGLIDPTKSDLVRTVMRGIRRSTSGNQRQAAPVLKEDLLPMLGCMYGTKGIRDRALILVGFAAALRRSELVALDVDELQFVSEGLLIYLSRSKTDQEGAGRRIAIPNGRTSACAVTAMRNWLAVSGITTGAVFRGVGKSGVIAACRLSDQSVSLIVKKYALAVGLPATAYSGHSLRAGLVTSATKAGVSFSKIQQQTGHRSTEMLTRYIRDANVFQDNAAGLLL